MCLKDFPVKEDILRAARNTPRIQLDGITVQIYPDIYPCDSWQEEKDEGGHNGSAIGQDPLLMGVPFKLSVPHNGTTYTATTVSQGKELLVKLSLLEP